MERVNGKKIKALILDRGLSVAEVAELAKCKPSTVANLMQGKTCRIITLGKIARALDVRGIDLLQDEKDE